MQIDIPNEMIDDLAAAWFKPVPQQPVVRPTLARAELPPIPQRPPNPELIKEAPLPDEGGTDEERASAGAARNARQDAHDRSFNDAVAQLDADHATAVEAHRAEVKVIQDAQAVEQGKADDQYKAAVDAYNATPKSVADLSQEAKEAIVRETIQNTCAATATQVELERDANAQIKAKARDTMASKRAMFAS